MKEGKRISPEEFEKQTGSRPFTDEDIKDFMGLQQGIAIILTVCPLKEETIMSSVQYVRLGTLDPFKVISVIQEFDSAVKDTMSVIASQQLGKLLGLRPTEEGGEEE